MGNRQPSRPPPPPTVQRLRIRYAKRDRLRFTSHRDVARVFERALRRARLPMAFSAGFSPHPKVSWVGATPTGVASEAEYVEIGLAERREPADVSAALAAALPAGIDVVEVVEARTGSLPDRVQASVWQIVLPGVSHSDAAAALAAFLGQTGPVPVQRRTRDGVRNLDARAPVISGQASGQSAGSGEAPPPSAVRAAVDVRCAILELVVRHETPTVRPDDILAGIRLMVPLELAAPARVTRLRQGPLSDDGEVSDPFAPDRAPSGEPQRAGGGT